MVPLDLSLSFCFLSLSQSSPAGNCCSTRAIWKDEEEAGEPQKGTRKNCYPSAGRRLIKMLFSRHCDIFLFYVFHQLLFEMFIVSRQFSSTLPSRLASARLGSGCCWRSSLEYKYLDYNPT